MANKAKQSNLALSEIGIEGFKSIRDRHDVELRQLTILAGANSTGKSSLMQPLLLLKQTEDATFDPGPLNLGGPNVCFDSFEEAVWTSGGGRNRFVVRPRAASGDYIEETFQRDSSGHLVIKECGFAVGGKSGQLREGDQVRGIKAVSELLGSSVEESFNFGGAYELIMRVERQKCWLLPRFGIQQEGRSGEVYDVSAFGYYPFPPLAHFGYTMSRMLHVPGLRGNPERAYRVSAVGPTFPGLFSEYAASVVVHWKEHDPGRLEDLRCAMMALGLTCKVDAKRVEDTKVELRVGRLVSTRRGRQPTVNIADVGFGVSQSLAVVVALLAAEPGQLVYVEQPEIHLHPKAQRAMAEQIAKAAKRGVQLVIETHSELLLLGVQTLVAEGRLDPAMVKLHWFERDDTGATKITPADLDGNGAFGDWPENFGRANLDAQRAYLDAAHS